jgi:glycosyltransferase involved in cell wall biosynthesis
MIAGPDVTVVIPTRDRWRLLRATMASALAQEGVDLEVVLVDDGSETPLPDDLPGRSDPRVRLLRNPSGRGPAPARNAGIAAARGSWIAFLDDDDLWAPHKLRVQVAAASETAAPFVYGAALIVDGEGEVQRIAPAPSVHDLDRTLKDHCAIPAGASNVVASAEAVRKVGGFDEDLFHLADWDLWVRLRALGAPAVCEEPLVAYVQHRENMRALARRDVESELEQFDRKHLAGQSPGASRAWVWRWIADGHRAAGRRWSAARLELWASRRYGNPPEGVSGRWRAAFSLVGGRWARRARVMRAPGVPADRPTWL